MPAGSKSELLEVTRNEWAKLQSILQQFPAMLRTERDDDGVSAKDIVGHRAHWIELYLGWYRDGQAGAKVYFPAEGYKWNELKRYNADLRERQSALNWVSVTSMLETNHIELLAMIESLSDGQLYGGPMKGANNAWTVGRWAEAAGPSHYRSAAKYLKKRVRDAKAAD